MGIRHAEQRVEIRMSFWEPLRHTYRSFDATSGKRLSFADYGRGFEAGSRLAEAETASVSRTDARNGFSDQREVKRNRSEARTLRFSTAVG
jgi:hypothetical protein